MPDLVVDTAALRSAARALSTVASIADSLAGDHGRASALVPALGGPRPVQAASSFVSEWAYGSGWIATQATQAGANLTTTAATYEAIETILSAAVTGHASSAPLVPVPPPVVEPMRPVPHFGSRSQLFPVQLATARHVSELIPGDPDLSTELGRRLLGFSVQLADARLALAQVSLGTWVGATARAAAADLEELAGRLNAAENAFATAGDAISVYARVHSDARAQAARALAMWQAAEPAAKILRGAAVGPLPVGAPADPEAELARAGMLAREAQEMIATAGKALAERLEEAEHGAPNDPGWFSRLRRAVTSFVVGTAEGVWGMGEGVVALAALAVRANPARAVYDPQGYLASGEALWSAIEHGATHPGQVGAALIDLETWKDDPFRAAGRLVPDLIAIVGTAGAVGAARGAQATERLRTAAEVVEAARWRGTSNSASGVAAARLGELGLDPSSIVGRAAGTQLESLGLTVDRWMPTTVEPGQRFAMRPGSDIAVAVGDHLPWDARTFFEWQQSSPVRGRMADGSVTPPMYAEEVVVFEVRTPIDAASAIAAANRQLGEGGAVLTYIPGLRHAFSAGHVEWIGDHRFDAGSLEAKVEDATYRWADPNLPTQALDPQQERILGHLQGAADEAANSAGQSAVTAGAGASVAALEEGAQ